MVTHFDISQKGAQRAIDRASKCGGVSGAHGGMVTERPDLLRVELLRRAKLAGYDGPKAALYGLVRTLRVVTPRPVMRFDGLAGEFTQSDFGQVNDEDLARPSSIASGSEAVWLHSMIPHTEPSISGLTIQPREPHLPTWSQFSGIHAPEFSERTPRILFASCTGECFGAGAGMFGRGDIMDHAVDIQKMLRALIKRLKQR
jgi:hypothetical protein